MALTLGTINVKDANGNQQGIGVFSGAIGATQIDAEAIVPLDPITGLSASITPAGTPGSNAIAIQGAGSGAIPIPVIFQSAKPTTAAVTQYSVSTTAVQVLGTNPLRGGCIFYNAGSSIIYLIYGAAQTDLPDIGNTFGLYTRQLANGGEPIIDTTFNGPIFAISAAGQGELMVTELLP